MSCVSNIKLHDHVCQDPILSSCAHFICKSCLEFRNDIKTVKCKNCNKVNENDLNLNLKANCFDFIVKKIILKLYLIINTMSSNQKLKQLEFRFSTEMKNVLNKRRMKMKMKIWNLIQLKYFYGLFKF